MGHCNTISAQQNTDNCFFVINNMCRMCICVDNYRVYYGKSINSAGQPCSEIDYFLYNKSSNRNFSRKYIMDDLAVDVSDHYPISIVCDTDCEQRTDTDTKDVKSKINWEKVDKECYSEMVNQELTNRKVMEEAQKLESKYGIENMIVEISNILHGTMQKNVHLKKDKRRN